MAVCGVQRPRSAALLPERSGGYDVGCNVWLGVIFQSEPFLRLHGTRAGQGYGLRHRLVHPSRNILKQPIRTLPRGVPLEQRTILPGYFGRASGRERVCLYGAITVVADTLKQKKKHITKQ